MKIMASYGCKNNDENYFVTLETTADIQISEAPNTVEELFKVAKETVINQIAPIPSDFNKKENEENTEINEGNRKDSKNNGDNITPAQTKFLYQLLHSNKKISGEEATKYIKTEFKVQRVKDIPLSQASAFIKKMLEENSPKGKRKNFKRS